MPGPCQNARARLDRKMKSSLRHVAPGKNCIVSNDGKRCILVPEIIDVGARNKLIKIASQLKISDISSKVELM
jgi:hypothetical protein